MSYDIMKMGYFQNLEEALSNIDKILDRETFVVYSKLKLYTKIGNKLYLTGDIPNLTDLSEYTEITDMDTDFILQEGYYKIIGKGNKQYEVHVGENLEIADNEVITDVAGYVRVQGIEAPFKIAISAYPTLTDNTAGPILLEIESNFENSGDTEAIKILNIK